MMLFTVKDEKRSEFEEMRIAMFSAVPETSISDGDMSDPSHTKLSQTISSQ
jgi:hypothetical protein